jgi:hypothetical protein
VRSLPLWGPEERALISLATRVIDDTLSSDQVRRLLSTSSAMDLPSNISVDLWHFVRAVNGRRQTHEALDLGLLCSPGSARQYFGMVSPIRADSIGVDPVSGGFVVRIRDAQASVLRVSFPASPDSVMSPSSSSWPVRSAWDYNLAGDSQDRLLMTLLSVALGGASQSSAYSTQDQQERATLLGLLRMRTARILEADAKD